MRLELLPQKGTRNAENARRSRLKTLQRKAGSIHFSKWKDTCQSSACKAGNFSYQYQPVIWLTSKTDFYSKEKRKRKNINASKTNRKNRWPPKQATEKKPLKKQGRKPPEVAKMHPMMPPLDQHIRKTDGKQKEQQEIWKRHTQEMGTRLKYLQVPKPIGEKRKRTQRGSNKNIKKDKKQHLQGKT